MKYKTGTILHIRSDKEERYLFM